MTRFDIDGYRNQWQPEIDSALEGILDALTREPGCPAELARAMKYAVLGGGKRLRPLLCLGAARACGIREKPALMAGCAVELVHSYSLVHDDLPAMDDDDFRRGQPSCHKAFGEAVAILAGDALLTHAFQVLALGVPSRVSAQAVALLATAAGPVGMVGGQVDDVRNTPVGSASDVEFIHVRKTAALMMAAVKLGGLAAGAPLQQMEALGSFGQTLGLAFQIADDLLALEGDEKRLGRPAGSDQIHERRTHPLVTGPETSRQRAQELVQQAIALLEPFGDAAAALSGIAVLVETRIRSTR
jgi:geranylgeranyl diphosphate synthase, type II